MVTLVTGCTHTGKNLVCAKTAGEIQISLSVNKPYSALTDFLWPVVREIVKTCVENGQNLIVEGCYIPFIRKKDFADDYLCDRYFFHPIAPNPSRILWKFSYSISSENRYRQMYGSRFQKRHKQRNTHDDHNVTNDTAIIVGILFIYLCRTVKTVIVSFYFTIIITQRIVHGGGIIWR